MKKIITVLVLSLMVTSALAQEISKKDYKTIDKGASKIEKEYDEFDEKTSWQSPILKNVVFYKTKYKDGSIARYLRIMAAGSTLNVGKKGLTVIFEDGTRFERPDAKVDADPGYGSGWSYRIFERISDLELNLFATKKIKAYKLYIYEGALYGKDPLLTMGYAKGILDAN